MRRWRKCSAERVVRVLFRLSVIAIIWGATSGLERCWPHQGQSALQLSLYCVAMGRNACRDGPLAMTCISTAGSGVASVRSASSP